MRWTPLCAINTDNVRNLFYSNCTFYYNIVFLHFRYRMLNNGAKRFKTDGINSLKYRVNKIECNPLYTRILVDINEKEVMTAN